MLPPPPSQAFDARVEEAVEDLVVQMAQENPTWRYDRIVGAHLSPGLEKTMPTPMKITSDEARRSQAISHRIRARLEICAAQGSP